MKVCLDLEVSRLYTGSRLDCGNQTMPISH
jgi:hypothetical protein